MLRQIDFRGYKAFRDLNSIEVKPITLIIGKNSSGKSSLLKLFPMFSNMLTGKLEPPLLLNNKGISSGAEYRDLFHNRALSDLAFALAFDDDVILSANYIINGGMINISEYSVKHHDQIEGLGIADDKSTIHGLIEQNILNELQIGLDQLQLDVNYIGPFRRIAPHNVVFQGFDNTLEVGYDGTGAYNLLLNSYRSDKVLFNSVSEWMGNNLEGQQLDFSNTTNNSGTFNLIVRKGDLDTNITGVGQGVAQVLPIITQSYIARPNSLNIVEQPALHLHPACHACISYRLGTSAKERHCSYVIESHSENVLLGFRHMIVNPEVDFTPEDIVVYFINRNEEEQTAYLEKITINENGDLSRWPTGVFGEGFELLREINRMRR